MLKRKSNAGFTLVELCTVLGIMITLIALATLNYNRMVRKEACRAQILALQTFALEAQYKSMTQKKKCTLRLTDDKMEATHWINDTETEVTSVPVKYPMLGGTFVIEKTGEMSGWDASVPAVYLCIVKPPSDEVSNVLVLETVRVRTGIKKADAACAPENVKW